MHVTYTTVTTVVYDYRKAGIYFHITLKVYSTAANVTWNMCSNF
jgi:hypothetical protein